LAALTGSSVILARVTGRRTARATGKIVFIGCGLACWATDAYPTLVHIIILSAGGAARRAIASTAT